jgi:hypothetical protein
MKQIREPDHCFNPPIGRLILKSSGSAQAVRTVARTEPRGSTYYVLWPRKKKIRTSTVCRGLGQVCPGAARFLGRLPDNAAFIRDPDGLAAVESGQNSRSRAADGASNA